ncbi:MAG TPA: peptidoglycan DD-metalloendopeptidase family protein [Anaerolineales bacterium]|nr:peptidoglycan DD-metalloendopeptidase family protein [Anaerolineales bacterium]
MAITTKYGITIGPDTPTQTDLDVFYSLGFGAIKLLCGVHSPNTVTAFRGVGAVILQARIHYPEIADGRPPEQFVNDRRDAVAAFIDAGLGDFEILNEPNLSREGYGRSWNSADGFNNWLRDALNRLKQIFPNARFGFPGLSPHPADYANDPAVNRPLRPVGDIDFLDACNDAVLAADFLCAHTYWQNVDQMREVDSNGMGKGGLRFVRFYHERFPTLPIVISEFCNNRPGIGDYAADDAQWRVIGDEYAEFYTLCAQYSWVQACFARTLRDAALPDQSWLTPNLEQRRIIEGVKARPPIPEPSQFKLRWPTQFRRINQDYGMRQNDYLRYSGGYLHGGHEGVDIAAPEGTDIYASLPGVVVRSEASRGNFAGGYGAYGEVIAVDSDAPGIGRVTLTYAHFSRRLVGQGAVVQAGQRLGFAGRTGNAQGAHLHLSMRIAGIPLYTQLDYLNGGLYLDYDTAPPPPPTPANGSPRVQYARTVVLLPPPAGLDYVEAALRATWDTNRYTVGGSSDDGGVGDLDRRRVIAVNPQQWNGDLQAWYSQHYPGVDYVPVFAATPSALQSLLGSLNLGLQPVWTGLNRGRPREQYYRAYILIPPPRGLDWAITAARVTWPKYRITIGGSSDDGGIGALTNRRVIAINPNEWGGDLQGWYALYYPGVEYVPVFARDTGALARELSKLYP